MMMKSVFWWRKPEYPEETTDLWQVSQSYIYSSVDFMPGATTFSERDHRQRLVSGNTTNTITKFG